MSKATDISKINEHIPYYDMTPGNQIYAAAVPVNSVQASENKNSSDRLGKMYTVSALHTRLPG